MKSWSSDEINILRKFYPTGTKLRKLKEALPERSQNAIMLKARRLNLKRPVSMPWLKRDSKTGRWRRLEVPRETKEKIRKLYLDGFTMKHISELTGYKTGTVWGIIRQLSQKFLLTRRGGFRGRTLVVPNEGKVLAYAAGFLDGEGCIRAQMQNHSRTGPYCHCDVAITNTNIDVLKWFKSVFGAGSIRVVKYSPKNPIKARKVCYKWCLDRTLDVLPFLKAVAPYLIVKRQKAQTAINFIENCIRGRVYLGKSEH